jgi:hypothetical protein
VVSHNLLDSIYSSSLERDPNAFYSSSRKGTVHPSYGNTYRYFAHYIRVQALQRKPTETQRENNALRHRFAEDQKHFTEIAPEHKPLGQTLLLLFHHQLLLNSDHKTYLSNRYNSMVKWYGHWVAGDEKLFEYSGASGFLRMKKDKIGLWNYELCGRLSNNLPVLLYVQSHRACKSLNESVPTVGIVSDWIGVLQDAEEPQETILVMDCYYLDQSGRHFVLNAGIPYLAGLQACRFKSLADKAGMAVSKPGKTAILCNDDTGETFCHHWYADGALGKKYVFSNCLERKVGFTPKAWVPGCDDFSVMFNTCDHFNRALHDKSFPHCPASDSAAQHDFLFSTLLLNIYHIYIYLHDLDPATASYRDLMSTLADTLYIYGVAC